MAKQTYWVADEVGTYALVTGADERDRWVRGDWFAAEEPADDDWVLMWHEDIEQPGRVTAAGLRDLWAKRGWVAGPPPGGVHPFSPEPPAETAAESKPESKPAGGGTTKEK